ARVVRNRGIQLPDAAEGTTLGLAGGLVARSCRLCRAARIVACMGADDGCRDARGGHRYPRHRTPAGVSLSNEKKALQRKSPQGLLFIKIGTAGFEPATP